MAMYGHDSSAQKWAELSAVGSLMYLAVCTRPDLAMILGESWGGLGSLGVQRCQLRERRGDEEGEEWVRVLE